MWSLTQGGAVYVLSWNSTQMFTMQAWGLGDVLVPSAEIEEGVWRSVAQPDGVAAQRSSGLCDI